MYLRALQGREGALGEKHITTLETINGLGILYWRQGKIQEAEKMYLRALVGRKEALGARHTSTLEALNNLGIIYSIQDKMEAEENLLHALQGYEEVLGAKHRRTLWTVANLGFLYQDQGNLTDARKLFTLAAEGFEHAEGNYQADVAFLRERLANLSIDDGSLS